MAFLDTLAAEKPVRVHNLEIILRRTVEGDGVAYYGDYNATIEYDDGTTRTVTGKVMPHFTAAQVTWLRNLLDGLNTAAEGRITVLKEAKSVAEAIG